MKTLIKTVDGFDIYFEALEEHMSLREILPEETEEQLEEIYNSNVIFCAEVTAKKAGIELATDYLGCCIYEKEEDFYNTKGCYFDDMVISVIAEAKKELPNIIKELQN